MGKLRLYAGVIGAIGATVAWLLCVTAAFDTGPEIGIRGLATAGMLVSVMVGFAAMRMALDQSEADYPGSASVTNTEFLVTFWFQLLALVALSEGSGAAAAALAGATFAAYWGWRVRLAGRLDSLTPGGHAPHAEADLLESLSRLAGGGRMALVEQVRVEAGVLSSLRARAEELGEGDPASAWPGIAEHLASAREIPLTDDVRLDPGPLAALVEAAQSTGSAPSSERGRRRPLADGAPAETGSYR